jgi:hypothetical protein
MSEMRPDLGHLYDYRAQLLDRLESQPRELAAALAGVPEAEWRRRRLPEGRSPHLTAAHVRDLEALAFLPRIRRIVREDHPRLDAFPDHRWSEAQYDPEEKLAAILTGWAAARAELAALVRPLPHEAWSRLGFHPPSGSRTLQWWVERAYAHVDGHLKEIRGLEGS